MGSDFIEFDEALKIREARHAKALVDYKPKHTDAEYLAFLEEHETTTRCEHPQSSNQKRYLSLFTVASQHVYGDCLKECLDNAFDATTRRQLEAKNRAAAEAKALLDFLLEDTTP